MMERVVPKAAEQGYSPDFYISPDQAEKGRPYPYMAWKNFMHFGIADPRETVKVGDTVADIEEGINADCWTVGVVMGSSELGLNREEVAALTEDELEARKAVVKATYYKAGADYIIDDLSELQEVIADVNRRLAQNEDRKLLTPGPLSTRRSVKGAMLADHCTWDDEYKEITISVMNDITNIAANEDYATVLLQGSGSYAVEGMINCLCGKDDKILFLVNGEYGKRMVKIAEKSGRNHDIVKFDDTQIIEIEKTEKKLLEDKEIDAVMFVHCETTTGILNPLEALTRLAKFHRKKVFVDAMSSFAAYDIDMAGLDIDGLAASSNKCLEGPPGLSFVVAKKALLGKSEGRSCSHSLDLFDQYRELYEGGGKFRFTSPTNVLLALRQAVDEYKKEGGLATRRARYEENQKILVRELEKCGFRPIIAPEHQSCIITTFDPGDSDFSELYKKLKSKGFIIYPGKLTERPTFRVGSIGDVYPSDMLKLAEALAK